MGKEIKKTFEGNLVYKSSPANPCTKKAKTKINKNKSLVPWVCVRVLGIKCRYSTTFFPNPNDENNPRSKKRAVMPPYYPTSEITTTEKGN